MLMLATDSTHIHALAMAESVIFEPFAVGVSVTLLLVVQSLARPRCTGVEALLRQVLKFASKR